MCKSALLSKLAVALLHGMEAPLILWMEEAAFVVTSLWIGFAVWAKFAEFFAQIWMGEGTMVPLFAPVLDPVPATFLVLDLDKVSVVFF